MSEELKKVSQNLSTRETIAAVVWLFVGIFQCCTIIGFISGIWNIYSSIGRFKHAKAVQKPWRGIVGSYESWLGRMIKGVITTLIVGLFIGGVPSVIGFLYDLIAVRAYVLSNKDVYARAGL